MNFDWSIILNIALPIAVPVLFGIAAKNGRRIGKTLSTLGNTRLGKKTMDSIERGLIKFLNEFEQGLRSDNIESKVPKAINDAYNEAMK